MKSVRSLPFGPICCGVVSWLAAGPLPAHAQKDETPPPTPKASTEAPALSAADIERMNQNLSDLELLRPLLPLNLTQTQVDSLVAAMKQIAGEWREIKKQDDAALKALGPDIDKVHAAVLTGAPIPKEFDTKVADAQKSSAERINTARLSAMKRLLTVLVGSLTPTQKDAVEAWSVEQFGGRRIPKKYQANPASAPKDEVQALAIAALIERSLLLDRTLALLQQFKPAPPPAPVK